MHIITKFKLIKREMDRAFAFYLLQSYDDGARISNIYSKFNQIAPLSDVNTSIFQAYINLGMLIAHNLLTIFIFISKAHRNHADVKMISTSSSIIAVASMHAK